jgi:hypothetical protein
MKDRAVRLIEISLARDTLKLTPCLTTGMSVGANIATPEPAVIRAILIRTEVPRGVDRASASPGEEHHRRGRAECPGTGMGSLLTRFAERFVDVSRERFGSFGAFASGLTWLVGRLGWGTGMVRPPDMDDETNQHQSDHEELVKQDVRYHDDASFHDSKRRLFYRIDSRWNYPLSEGTRPHADQSHCIVPC